MSRLSPKPWGVRAAVAGALILFAATAPRVHADSTDGLVQQSTPDGDLGRGERFSSTAAGEIGALSTYMLCWEDRLGRPSDRSLDTMVIEIRVPRQRGEMIDVDEATTSEPLLIPLPPGVWSGLGGLLGLGVFGAVRRARGRRW